MVCLAQRGAEGLPGSVTPKLKRSLLQCELDVQGVRLAPSESKEKSFRCHQMFWKHLNVPAAFMTWIPSLHQDSAPELPSTPQFGCTLHAPKASRAGVQPSPRPGTPGVGVRACLTSAGNHLTIPTALPKGELSF